MKVFVDQPNSHQQSTHVHHYRSNSTQSGHANKMSSSQTQEPSTHGSSRHRQAAATPLRITTVDSSPLTQLLIPVPSDLA